MARMGADDLLIRTAKDDDEDAIARIDREAWSWLSDVVPQPAEDAEIFDDRRPPEQFLVAELDGRVVGHIRQAPPTPLASNRHVRQIQGLAVSPEAQGRGVGQALVEAACAVARADGIRKMTLRVLGHNAPARRLYERCGFVVDGVLPEEFLLDGRYVDDVWMGRPLND
ncbi:GNAT family N-acetyltransferase [Kitasatospora sp. NPDC096147]|uniref:GNAT family N-acetyltransferase n=1 Tax=Kitasatospora sp. NPDC096147 TaxID=3364093 RepID=UPI003801FEBD